MYLIVRHCNRQVFFGGGGRKGLAAGVAAGVGCT